jgi:hypothetical protein
VEEHGVRHVVHGQQCVLRRRWQRVRRGGGSGGGSLRGGCLRLVGGGDETVRPGCQTGLREKKRLLCRGRKKKVSEARKVDHST